MKLLIVTGIFPPDSGGPAGYVPRIAAALTERGHHVEVICLSDRLDHNDTIYPFPVHRIRRGLFWPLRLVVTTFTIWRAARRNDLVYVNNLGSESALAALLAGRPAVHKVVGDYAWERANGKRWFTGTLDDYQTAAKSLRLCFLDFVRTFPLRLARRVIVPSGYLKRIVTGWGIDNVSVIFNAVEPGAPADTVVHNKTLLTVCRLVPWKGVDGIIQILPELPDTRLVVAGDGDLRPQLETQARDLGVANRVQFLGNIPHAAVGECLRQADAFVLNSTYEGLPHVVLEAMAAGVPVIATDAGGTGEVVQHNVTGLLVPVGDTAALKHAVERLWSDATLGLLLTATATRQLATRFSFDTMVTSTETTLAEAAA